MNRYRQPPRHRGVSILEVLFAIMITSIGLMGAIAVFPAALLQTKRGQQADATAAAAHYAIHSFDAMGMRRADRWLTFNSGSYQRVPAPDGAFAYCIDPRFIAANQSNATTRTNANNFPYGPTTSVMQRVTLNTFGTIGNETPMTALQAELGFRIEDDLAYHRFTGQLNGIDVDRTNHSESLFVRGPGATANALGPALKRESSGHMSWMATLSPKLERLETGGAIEDRYVLSVVVFHDRPTELDASRYLASEWSLNVNMAGPNFGSGIGGGDMQLTEPNTDPALPSVANERILERGRRLDIRRDQWIMLISYTSQPSSTGGSPRISPICRWYRVIESDEANSSTYSVDVTLAGSDWEATGQPTYAVVCQGVVAVFEKTIQLEPAN